MNERLAKEFLPILSENNNTEQVNKKFWNYRKTGPQAQAAQLQLCFGSERRVIVMP
jgi:hypothetical protein